jgi:hypothetical protein
MTDSTPGLPLAGVMDLHIHSDPDSMPRSMHGIEVAALAKKLGMRTIVLKNHFEHTASLAYLARTQVPGIEVFGGIALNLSLGGINPFAIERMIKVKGNFGRFVWMPTFDAENHVRRFGGGRPFVPVAKDGELLSGVIEVIKMVARENLVFATGHSSPAETLLLIRAARDQGVKKIVATHSFAEPVFMNQEETRKAAALGAFVEFTCLEFVGPKLATSASNHAAAIRAIGVEHCFLSSDLGQAINSPPPDGFAAFISALGREGFSPSELDVLTKRNPGRVMAFE